MSVFSEREEKHPSETGSMDKNKKENVQPSGQKRKLVEK